MDFLPLPHNKTGNEDSKVKENWWTLRVAAFKEKWVNGDSLFGSFLALWFLGLAMQFYYIEDMRKANEFELYIYERFDLLESPAVFRNNLWIPFVISLAYIGLITLGPMYMKDKTRPEWLKPWVVAWNVFLVIFSTAGAYNLVPCITTEIYYNIKLGVQSYNQPHNLFCHGSKERGESYKGQFMWLFLFCSSKIPEMIDTVLLVVNKKNIIFLHWFHHLTVMIFCWLSWAYQTPVGIAYAGMNYTVHSLMYAWYGFAAKGLKPKRLLSQAVTVMQIVQMIFGSILALYVAFVKPCENHKLPVAMGLFIYGTYLLLFVQFYVNAYCRKRKRKAGGKSKKS